MNESGLRIYLNMVKDSLIKEKLKDYICRKLASVTVFKRYKRRIIYLYEDRSGSNSLQLYKFMTKRSSNTYENILIKDKRLDGFFERLNFYRKIASARLVITTHRSVKLSEFQLHYQLWHGPMIKKNGVMFNQERTSSKFNGVPDWNRANFILSYSQTYTTLVNGCMVTDPNKYIVTGAPRNDLLYDENDETILTLKSTLGIPAWKKIILVAFTYGNTEKNLSFVLSAFSKYKAIYKDYFVIFKSHPAENDIVLSHCRDWVNDYMLVTDERLQTLDIDLYHVLNFTDILITDYSSIFIDFLLKDRNIIFINLETSQSEFERGFLFENMVNLFPGSIVADEDQLIQSLKQDEGVFRIKRHNFSEQFHRYTDANSSERIAAFLDNLLCGK